MLHKGFKRCLSSGSMSKSNKINSKCDAFSIAEMLVVLGIVSFLAIGMPAVNFKKNELKTQRSLHGRYECYYNGNALMQYSVTESGVATGPTAVGTCSFTPPPSAVFFFVHAVGGGGGGVAATNVTTYTASIDTVNIRRNNVMGYPEWMKDVLRAKQLPATTNLEYVTKAEGLRAFFKYGNSGGAGQTVSMFFPALNNVTLAMTPGLGGGVGAGGGSTLVKFNGTTIISAAGGTRGSGTGNMTLWLNGEGTVCAVKNLNSRIFNPADFSSNVELDTGSTMASKMVEAQAGSGGAGGYSNLPGGNSVMKYTIDGVDVSTYVKKDTCTDALKCDDGTSGTLCPVQNGRNGAVVILW